MSPDQARQRARRLEQDLLVAEAAQAALGWMYLTVEGIDIDSEPARGIASPTLSRSPAPAPRTTSARSAAAPERLPRRRRVADVWPTGSRLLAVPSSYALR
jgi:hypothetical protein